MPKPYAPPEPQSGYKFNADGEEVPLIPTTTDYERLRNHDAKLKERMRRQRLLSGETPTAPRLGEWAVKPNARQRPRTGGPLHCH